MAKIYETQADFEKDKLKEQAYELRRSGDAHNNASWMFLGGSLLADLWNATKAAPSRVLSVAGWGMLFASIIQTVRSWQAHSKAHDLELERERLGPEMAVLPPGVQAPDDKDCGCDMKHAVSPKSLLEQAAKAGFPLSRE